MLAFGISVALFLFWLWLGMGILAGLRFSRHAIRNLLLAPVIGASAILLPEFWLSRSGLPVKSFATWLTLALLAAGCALWIRFRPRLPWKSYLSFVALLALGAGLTARPMFWYGFNWVSYGNDDMANYVLAAQRLYEHGLNDNPTVAEYLSDRDPSLHYWFYHVYAGTRTGSEMLLAWLHGVAGRTTLELFMPLIVALYFALLSAAAGMMYRTAGHRKKAIWTGFLLVCSALTSLGLLYQLIAQVWGLALLAVCVALLVRPLDRMSRPRLIRNAVLVALVIATVVISYPEMLPFVIFPAAVYAVVRAWRKGAWRALALPYGLISALVLLFINTYLRTASSFLAIQLFKGVGGNQALIFPYFLVPSGMANFWGLLPIELRGAEPWLSRGIAAGGILLIVAIIIVLWQAIRREPWALVAALMFLLAAQLFIAHSDFGLFKLTMFVQPFLLGTLAATGTKHRFVHGPLMLLLAGLGLHAQYIYVERSTGEFGRGGSGLVEVPGASASGLVEQLLREREKPEPKFIVSDTTHTSLGKYQSAALFGRPIIFPGDDIFGGVVGVTPRVAQKFFAEHGIDLLKPEHAAYAEYLRDSRKATYAKEFFQSPDKANEADMFYTPKNEQTRGDDAVLLASHGLEGITNRIGQTREAGLRITKLADVRNHLVFVSSALGRPPAYDGDRTGMGLFRLEPDPTYERATVAGIGHFLLFEILNASPSGRVTVNVTSTYMADGKSRVPPARVMGIKTTSLGAVGRGSARLFSPEIAPQWVDGRPYILLDMGAEGTVFPERKTGLMGLFGRDVQVDGRRMLGFARDISFLAPEAFAALTPPEAVAEFPKGLTDPALEYSGLYEDGWVGEDCFLRLRQPGGAVLRVAGTLPRYRSGDSSNHVRILQDGAALLDSDLPQGNFDFQFPDIGGPGQRVVRIQFRSARPLSDDDPRPASAHLSFVGFEKSMQVPNDITDASVSQIGARNWHPVEHSKGLKYRWVTNDAELIVRSKASRAAVTLDVEPGPSQGDGKLALQLVDDTGRLVTSTELAGRQLVQANLPVATSGEARYRLHVGRTGTPVPGDGRTLNFRVFHVGPPRDFPALNAGIEYGKGWYGLETFEGQTFRWVKPVSELYVTDKDCRMLTADVDPNSGGLPVQLDVWDGRGQRLFQTLIHKRSKLKIPVRVEGEGRTGLLIRLDRRKILPAMNDSRQLALRVFGIQLE